MAARLKEKYNTEIRTALQKELGLDNIMQVPRLEKIVMNSGVGRATQQASLLEGAQRDLEPRRLNIGELCGELRRDRRMSGG